jgi:hypothetical protein
MQSAAAAAEELRLMHVQHPPNKGAVSVTLTPAPGSEGYALQVCAQAGDKLGGVLFKGMCWNSTKKKACGLDADCGDAAPLGACAPLCIRFEV